MKLDSQQKKLNSKEMLHCNMLYSNISSFPNILHIQLNPVFHITEDMGNIE